VDLELVDLKDVPNHDILNAIRNEGTMEYQARIPEATKGNIQDTLENLTRYRPQMNQFISAFVNQIGLIMAQNISWSNPLAEFKKGLLTHGDTIEDYMVDLVEAHTYSHDRNYMEKDLFGQYTPRVKTNFHRINREEFYPVTIKESVLRRAFLNDTGLTGLSAQIMQAPMESDQWDEFLVMVNLFAEYEKNGGFFKVQVPALDSINSTDANARTVLKVMRAFIDTLSFRSRKYNPAAMSTAAKPEDLVIFCTPEFRAAVDVDALAGAFNLDKSNLNARIIAIPAEHFGIEGAQAIMTTRNFFIVGDTLWQTTSQENAVGLTHNFYLHHHQIVSASTFVPAVLFTTKSGDEVISIQTPVTGITDVAAYDRLGGTVTSVTRGELYSLTSEAITDGPNDGVKWSVAGATSLQTYITQQGVLHVGADEPSTTITVKATTTWIDPNDPQKDGYTDTLVLAVTGSLDNEYPESAAVTGITVEGVAVSPAFTPGTLAYTVIVPGGTTTLDEIVVEGPDTADVTITLNEAGDSFTVYSPTSPGDPTYTVTVN
jgi:hypothetical protein